MDTQIDLAALIERRGMSRFSIWVMVWASVSMFIEGFEMQIPGYAAPVMIKALGVDKASFGAVFGAGNFGYLLGALSLSALGDRFGRRALLIAGVLIFSICTLITAMQTALLPVAVLRFLAGVGLGGAVPNAIALTAEYAPKGSRGMRITLLYVAYTIGGAGTGLLAGSMMPAWGWPIVFWVGGIVGLVLSVLLAFFLPESARYLALTQPGSAGLRDIVQRLEPGISATAPIVLAEEKPGRVPAAALFQDGRAPITLLLWLAYITGIMALQFMTSWLPTLINGSGIAVSLAVYIGALFHVGGTFGNVAAGRLLDKKGIIAIAAGFAVAVPVVALMGPGSAVTPMLMGLVLLAGFLIVGSVNGINAVAGTIYPSWMRASGSGWTVGIGRVGSIIGPVVGGILISLGWPIGDLFLVVCVPVAITALALAALAIIARRRA